MTKEEKKRQSFYMNPVYMKSYDFVNDPTCIPLGITEDNEIIYWHQLQNQHLLVTGSCGSGKTSLCFNVLQDTIYRRGIIFGVDYSRVEIYFYEPFCKDILLDSTNGDSFLENLENAAKGYVVSYSEPMHIKNEIYVYIASMPALIQSDNDHNYGIWSRLWDLCNKYKNIHLVCETWTSTNIPQELHDNSMKIVCGANHMDKEQLKYAFGGTSFNIDPYYSNFRCLGFYDKTRKPFKIFDGYKFFNDFVDLLAQSH